MNYVGLRRVHFLCRLEERNLKIRGDFSAADGIQVGYSDDFDIFQALKSTDMVGTDLTGSNDSDAIDFHKPISLSDIRARTGDCSYSQY